MNFREIPPEAPETPPPQDTGPRRRWQWLRDFLGLILVGGGFAGILLTWGLAQVSDSYARHKAREERTDRQVEAYVEAVHYIISQPTPSHQRAEEDRALDAEKYREVSARFAVLQPELSRFAQGLTRDLTVFNGDLKTAVIGAYAPRASSLGEISAFAQLRRDFAPIRLRLQNCLDERRVSLFGYLGNPNADPECSKNPSD